MNTYPALILGLLLSASLANAAELQPLLAQPDQIVYQSDFSNPDSLNKEHWAPRQATRWSIADGVLRGIPSTLENQASKPDHKGLEPRISAPVTPTQFVAKFSVRFTGGSETFIVPFVEFGHHVVRVRFTQEGVFILGDHDSTKLAETTALKYEPGRWYHCLAELKGDEFVIQFADGPTLYAQHASYAQSVPSGGNGLGIAGPKDGTAEIDNVTFWSIKSEPQASWAVKRDTFPKFNPVPVKEEKGQVRRKAKA